MNKFKLLVAPLLVIPFIASCGGGGSDEYKVSIPDTNGVSVYPGQAYKGKEYVGTIEIATDIIDKQVLPDTLDKVTSGNSVLQPTEYTYTLKEDKLIADFKVPAANVVGDIQIQLTLVEKPGPEPVDPNVVTEDEFDAALAFKNDTYIQVKQVSEESVVGTAESTYEVAPDKSHVIHDNSGMYASYSEYFVKKEEGELSGAYRNSKEGEFEEATTMLENNFYTPEKLSKELTQPLGSLTFKDFEYKNNVYTAKGAGAISGDATFTLKFENKKLISYSDEDDIMGTMTSTFKYEETFPEWPKVVDPHEVNADEFADALALKNSEYIQEIDTLGDYTCKVDVAPNLSHCIEEDTGDEPYYYEYFVKYEDNVYSGLYRDSLIDAYQEFESPEEAESHFFTPDSLADDLTRKYTFPEFDKCTYENQVYTGEGGQKGGKKDTPTTFVFDFFSKKLDLLTANVQGVGETFTYDFSYYETFPEWPTQSK